MSGALRQFTARRQVAAGPAIVDDFNRADESPIQAPWEVVAGTPRIRSERIDASGADGTARHSTTLGSADHYAEIDVVGAQGDQSVCVRFAAAANTFYMFRHNSSSPGEYEIYKRVAGSFTLLASVTEAVPALPYRLRAEVEGTALRLYVNGALKLSDTDGSISGNTQVGFRMNGSTHIADNFEAGVL